MTAKAKQTAKGIKSGKPAPKAAGKEAAASEKTPTESSVQAEKCDAGQPEQTPETCQKESNVSEMSSVPQKPSGQSDGVDAVGPASKMVAELAAEAIPSVSATSDSQPPAGDGEQKRPPDKDTVVKMEVDVSAETDSANKKSPPLRENVPATSGKDEEEASGDMSAPMQLGECGSEAVKPSENRSCADAKEGNIASGVAPLGKSQPEDSAAETPSTKKTQGL